MYTLIMYPYYDFFFKSTIPNLMYIYIRQIPKVVHFFTFYFQTYR